MCERSFATSGYVSMAVTRSMKNSNKNLTVRRLGIQPEERNLGKFKSFKQCAKKNTNGASCKKQKPKQTVKESVWQRLLKPDKQCYFDCPLCHGNFNKNIYSRHFKECYKFLTCNFCQMSFDSHRKVIDHKKTHMSFDSHRKMIDHKKTHKPQKEAKNQQIKVYEDTKEAFAFSSSPFYTDVQYMKRQTTIFNMATTSRQQNEQTLLLHEQTLNIHATSIPTIIVPAICPQIEIVGMPIFISNKIDETK